MSEIMEDNVPRYQQCRNIPFYTNEEIIDTPDNEIDVVNEQNEDMLVDVYEEEEDDDEVEGVSNYYFEMVEQTPVMKKIRKDTYTSRKNEKIQTISNCIAAEKVDLINLGTNLMVGTSDKILNQQSIERAVKAGTAETNFLGDISIEALVEGMMQPSASDGRFAMLGTSVMWNALKSNMRDLKGNIMQQTTQTMSEPRFDAIDLNIDNISPQYQKFYKIRKTGVFMHADLHYVFRMLRFRKSAKLLNKTKQFLKAYFIVACRPRCMIWRYTLRRSGNCNKKAILNMPNDIVQTILNVLIDLTGIGSGDKPYEEMDRSIPFYQSLGEDNALREQRYYEACKLKDSLISYFRDVIVDCLNEIREMPFCTDAGILISPLRGRSQSSTCVMWKDYESYLKKEQEEPSEENIKSRMSFEQRLCTNTHLHPYFR